MELPRREFLHLAAGRSSARRFSHSNPLLVLALLVLENGNTGKYFNAITRRLQGRWTNASADLLDHRLPQRLLASPPASSATASQPLPTALDSDFGLTVAAVGTRPELTAATG